MAISLKQHGVSAEGETQKKPERAASGDSGGLLKRFINPVKPAEVLFFTSQISLMLEIGTPLAGAISTIRDQTENPAFRELIADVLRDIEAGRQLSDAMRRHPRVFDHVFVSMVHAGETGGFLKDILDRLVEIQEKRQVLKTQLRSALTYPAVLCVVAFVVIIFVLVFVLPKFTGFFAGKESILPFTTRFMMSLSASLKAHWWIYILSGVGSAIGLKTALDSKAGQAFMGFAAVKAPYLSRLFTKINTCHMLRTLGNLMESQVSLVEALQVTRSTLSNPYFRSFIDRIVEHVKEGGKFSQPFASFPYTLDSVKKMVATGEEAGNLPKVMLRLAKFYDAEVDREVKNFSSMIEPAALVVMGGVVGLIVSSVILPLFKLSSAIH